MSKINELMKELCPNGVERVKLGEVCEVSRGKRLVRKELSETGKIPVFQNSLQPLGYHSQSNCFNSAFIISAGAAEEVGYYEQQFWAADDCLIIKSTRLLTIFVYVLLKNQEPHIKSQIRGGAIKRLSKDVVEKIEIPLPPLAIQQEIVNILNKFTSLIDNLDETIQLRQKQYEYYREKLLTFKDGECEKQILNEVCEVVNGRAYKQAELLSQGKYRVLRVGNFFSNDSWYYSDLELVDKYYAEKGDLLYAWSASFGPHIWEEEKVIYHYHIWKLNCSVSLCKKYLYYWLQTSNMENQVSSEKHGATMAHLTKALMENLIIPVPPLPRQQEIVATLDKFEAMISNLKQERELRQKQYEYYREKLLTFE